MRAWWMLAMMAVPAAGRTLDGAFGRVDVDLDRPGLTGLTLRRPDGELEPHSLLSPAGAPWQRGMPDWGTGGLTYAVDETGRRYESRRAEPSEVLVTADGVELRGVTLRAGDDEPVAVETWRLRLAAGELVWRVDRVWRRELTVTSSGLPALFFSCRPVGADPSTILPNSVATTFWIDPDRLRGWHNPFYRPAQWTFGYKLALENNVVVDEPGGWATLKLMPAWPHESEPRLTASAGHLYRRGHFGWLSEVGLTTHAEPRRTFGPGDRETGELRLGRAEAFAGGHQLAVTAVDPTGTIDALRRFYGAWFNGGCVNDALRYHFGNETDGWYYGGASWMKGLPMLAGAPAGAATSAWPLELPRAFADNLRRIAGTEFQPGRTRFGYNAAGGYVDDNLNQVLGGRAYYLYSGDLPFVRQMLPFYRRAVDWFLEQRNADGLIALDPAHWYYDAMLAAGVTTYHNAFCYRALIDLAELESAAGNAGEATRRRDEAADLKAAVNRVLWWPEAPGGPRYVDWILPDGTKIAYAADLCLFPPIAFGIASPEQARALLATIDRRIAELERDHGYAGLASLSAYWPVPERVNTHPANQGFGHYMNGGSFLAMTYWEVTARALAGDAEGAWNRLRRFAEGTRLTGQKGFIGNNWVRLEGWIGWAAADEPYLSDAIAVPAALVQGVLGIKHTNAGLEVTPHLPADLPRATVEVVSLGRRQRVTIDGERVTIDDLGVAFRPEPELIARIGAGCPPEADLYLDRTFGDGGSAEPEVRHVPGQGLELHRQPTSPLVALFKLDGNADDGSAYRSASRAEGAVSFGAADRAGRPAAAAFAGGQILVGDTGPLRFGPAESFTVQGWFRTASEANQVIVARPGCWSLGVKEGRLSAWIMEDSLRHVEAAGATRCADDAWHHAAVVYDRVGGTITCYLDGRPDSPVLDISGIGAATGAAPLSVGDFGGGFPFAGWLDEVSVHRGVMPAAALAAELAPEPPEPLGALRGLYTTPVFDWGQAARPTSLRVESQAGDGTATLVLEISSDGFVTIAGSRRWALAGGRETLTTDGLPPATTARLTVELSTAQGARRSPWVRSLELRAVPAEP